ncbi:hypothetical protein HZS_3090 [Henneguya salminicola]|nr:hypothetical protein HZS_3090 [Henneguya salminicola]
MFKLHQKYTLRAGLTYKTIENDEYYMYILIALWHHGKQAIVFLRHVTNKRRKLVFPAPHNILLEARK